MDHPTQVKPIFNPLNRDFVWSYLDDSNTSCTQRLPAQEITYLPVWLADLMATHLADEILWDRGIKRNAQDDRKEIMKEIEVHYE